MAMKLSTLVVSVSVNIFTNCQNDQVTSVYFSNQNVENLSKNCTFSYNLLTFLYITINLYLNFLG